MFIYYFSAYRHQIFLITYKKLLSNKVLIKLYSNKYFFYVNILIMNFEQSIQQWVSIDNQIKLVNTKLKELRDKKNFLSSQINDYVENNELNESTIKVTDGSLKFVKIKETQQLTFKYLETCLKEIIKNEQQVNQIVEYVRNKRSVNIVPEIKRFYNK